jgi:DNA polymerase-3 subunit delta'
MSDLFRGNIESLMSRDKFPHSVIFAAGEEEISLKISEGVGAALFCRCAPKGRLGGCGECEECRLFNSQNHPDFIVVNCAEKEEGNAEAIRSLLSKLALRSFRGGARVVLLKSSEELGVASSNILLKSLEEPLPNTYFILTCKNPSRLLPTILSRCQRWFVPHEESSLSADEDKWGIRELLARVLKREVSAAIELASLIHKDKENAPQMLTATRAILRIMLKDSTLEAPRRHSLALLLMNFLEAEYFISERNSNSQYILAQILTNPMDGDLREGLV